MKIIWILLALVISGMNAWATYAVLTYDWSYPDTTAVIIWTAIVGIATYGATMMVVSSGQRGVRI